MSFERQDFDTFEFWYLAPILNNYCEAYCDTTNIAQFSQSRKCTILQQCSLAFIKVLVCASSQLDSAYDYCDWPKTIPRKNRGQRPSDHGICRRHADLGNPRTYQMYEQFPCSFSMTAIIRLSETVIYLIILWMKIPIRNMESIVL